MRTLRKQLTYLEEIGAANGYNTTAADLADLACSLEEDVRCGVADNGNTSPETLTLLAADGSKYVRFAVERNPNTPPAVKLWLQSGYRKVMPLEDFLRAIDSGRLI